jgi:hypothetical protein
MQSEFHCGAAYAHSVMIGSCYIDSHRRRSYGSDCSPLPENAGKDIYKDPYSRHFMLIRIVNRFHRLLNESFAIKDS